MDEKFIVSIVTFIGKGTKTISLEILNKHFPVVLAQPDYERIVEYLIEKNLIEIVRGKSNNQVKKQVRLSAKGLEVLRDQSLKAIPLNSNINIGKNIYIGGTINIENNNYKESARKEAANAAGAWGLSADGKVGVLMDTFAIIATFIVYFLQVPSDSVDKKSNDPVVQTAASPAAKVVSDSIAAQKQSIPVGKEAKTDSNAVKGTQKRIIKKQINLYAVPKLKGGYCAENSGLEHEGKWSLYVYLFSVGGSGSIISLINPVNNIPYEYKLSVAKSQRSTLSNNYNDFSVQSTFEPGNNLCFVIYYNKEMDYDAIAFDIVMVDQYGIMYKQKARPKLLDDFCLAYELSKATAQ